MPRLAGAQEKLTSAENEQQYAACMALVDRNPTEALESAVAWEKQGGADAAQHCQALAYIGLKQYEDAGVLLERIAETMPQVKAPIASEVFGQAAYAWMLADKSQRALHDLNQGLSLSPRNVELLIDRARLYGESGMYFEALDDLNTAADLSPNRPDIYAYRASAYVSLSQLDIAADNLDQALAIAPDYPQALLERGRLHALNGDKDAARKDFLRVLEVAPKTDVAGAAQEQLEKLDLKAE
ncbi:tetratricopeptide repeat protein [Dongia sp.]|uniref:tetratricopeptide repeat protein n=1 Tax=Dongia sp. TaxID=1977262 RepID=UPI0035B0502E